MTTKATTPAQFIKELPEDRRKDIIALDKLIRKAAPKLKPYIQSGMLAYGKYHYKYASGREGDWSQISLASQKNYISLYVSAVDGDKYVPELYKKELPKANIGRSCIRFKKLADLDLKTLETVIKHGAKAKPQM